MKKYNASILAVTLIILSIVLVMALSISVVALKQRYASLGSGKSNQAFQSADRGVEEVMNVIMRTEKAMLSEITWPSGLSCIGGVLSGGGGSFSVQLLKADGTAVSCSSATYVYEIDSIKSTGYGANQEFRAVEAAVAATPSLKARMGGVSYNQGLTASIGNLMDLDPDYSVPAGMNDGGNNRITPKLPGYYLVSGMASAWCSEVTDSFAYIARNGSEVARGTRESIAGLRYSTMTALVYLNGSGDFVDLHMYVSTVGCSAENWQSYLTLVGPF